MLAVAVIFEFEYTTPQTPDSGAVQTHDFASFDIEIEILVYCLPQKKIY